MYDQPQDKATDRYHDRLKKHHKKLLTLHQYELPWLIIYNGQDESNSAR